MEGCSGGAGGRAGVACRPRLMLLRSSHILSVLVRSMQSSGSGGGEKCQAPTHLQWWFFSKWLQAALFLHHYFGAVCARTARSEFQNAVSLCEPTTGAEFLAWSCISAGYGAHGYCSCTCYCCYVYEFGGGEQRWRKYRRRNVLDFPLTVSM